jgi:hypothetical protein
MNYNYLCNIDFLHIMNVKAFIFSHVFNHTNDIHSVIMSFIKGKYYSDWKNQTYIDIACKKGYLFMIKDYIKCGIKPSIKGANYAAKYGHLHIIKYLQKINIFCSIHGINMSIEYGHTHIAKHFKQYGKLCDKSAINMALQNGHLETIKYIFNNYDTHFLYRNKRHKLF